MEYLYALIALPTFTESLYMNELPYIDTPTTFQQELKGIAALRKSGKLKAKRQYRLTKEERKIIHMKTGGKCQVCGQEVLVDKFEADHVKSYSSGGTSITDNFLPACRTCNNYRWHYLPAEFQWILKLGVWARTEIANDSDLGRLMANVFIGR
ncbi:MAG: HNH endonuclease signature motif containing protein [Parafilimonas sp.]